MLAGRCSHVRYLASADGSSVGELPRNGGTLTARLHNVNEDIDAKTDRANVMTTGSSRIDDELLRMTGVGDNSPLRSKGVETQHRPSNERKGLRTHRIAGQEIVLDNRMVTDVPDNASSLRADN